MKAVPKLAATKSVTSETPSSVTIVVTSIFDMVAPFAEPPSVSSAEDDSIAPTPM